MELAVIAFLEVGQGDAWWLDLMPFEAG